MEGLAELARFLPEFERPDFRAGEWRGGELLSDHTYSARYVAYGDIVQSFIETAYRHGWVSADFDWPAWAQSPAAARLRDDQRALDNATARDLGRLLTVGIRQDRFVEGALLDAFESGLIVRIARRARILAEHSSPQKRK